MLSDPSLVRDVAAELGVSATFVEKDWFSVQVVKAITRHEDDGFQTLFSGGAGHSRQQESFYANGDVCICRRSVDKQTRYPAITGRIDSGYDWTSEKRRYIYRREYSDFVDAMSYNDEVPSFDY